MKRNSFLLYILLAAVIISFCVYLYPAPYNLPKIIWMYWDTPDVPLLIQQIHTYNIPNLKGWDIRFLNKTLLPNFIDDYEYPKHYNTLKPQHQADWIRLNLLSKYGGVWMDASILVNDPDALNRLHRQSLERHSHMTGFSFQNTKPHCTSNRNLSLYVENWFIMAPTNSIIIREWFKEYHEAVTIGFLAYKRRLTAENIDLHLVWDSHVDTDVYLTQHACLQYILQKKLSTIPPMIINPAEHDMLKDICGMENRMKCLRDHPEEARKTPYIKLVRSDRKNGVDISPFFSS